jgi:hypothetical protein
MELDVPRIFQVVRTALLRTNSVWTTMTGFSYYYLGIGGEIGYDAANGFNDSIPVHSRPFTGTNISNWYEQSIINAVPGPCSSASPRCAPGVKYVAQSVTNGWWGLNWIGELYPDSAFATWRAEGNLPTGLGANNFRRVPRETLAPSVLGTAVPATRGTRLTQALRRTRQEGSPTFFSAGTAYNRTFHHLPNNNIGTLQADGREINTVFNFPEANPIPNNRPFLVNTSDGDDPADGFLQAPYGSSTTLERLNLFYRHSNGNDGSSLVVLRETSSRDTAFVIVNGLSPTGESGTSFIARWSFLTLIQSYLLSGLYDDGTSAPKRTFQLPQIAITAPNLRTNLVDASSIDIAWDSNWLRWNGVRYTSAYPSGFAETAPLLYYVMYSTDNGSTWVYAKTGAAAEVGQRGPLAASQTTTSYRLSTPAADFPQGNYLLRVEAYRRDLPLHYATHQVRVFIRRTS